MLFLMLLCCCFFVYMALRRRLAKRRAKKIKDKIEKLKGLKDVMKAAGLDESGVDADAYRIMQDAIRQSWQQGRKLPVVAKEILKDHKPPEPSALATSAPPTDDKIVVEERKQMQTEKPWTSILHAAYEVFNQKKGRRAEHRNLIRSSALSRKRLSKSRSRSSRPRSRSCRRSNSRWQMASC